MTYYDEKVAYYVKHGVHNTVDTWIAKEKTCTKAPTADPNKRGPSLEYLYSPSALFVALTNSVFDFMSEERRPPRLIPHSIPM
jgi:hypothetical protein